MNAQAKTINLLLYDGSLNGVISIEDSGWNSGELYSAPREAVSDLLKTDACSKYGVYLLLSKDMVYVGQSSDLAKRLSQHIIGKDWWESAVILTTKDDSLNHSDIDYIENLLIERAFSLEKLDCENKKKGNPPKVDKFRKVYLGQYLEEALFLMQLIGINVFSDEKKSVSKPLIDTLTPNISLSLGKRVKAEAVKYAKENGACLVEKNTSYAVLQRENGYYWINPKVHCIKTDWSLILNNTQKNELVILSIPSDSLSLESSQKSGLKVRADKPDLIQLKITEDRYIDIISSVDFSRFIQKIIKY